MYLNKIKKINEIKKLKILDLYESKINANTSQILDINSDQVNEIESKLKIETIFKVSKNKVKFFNLEIYAQSNVFKIEDNLTKQTHYLKPQESITVTPVPKGIKIENKSIEILINAVTSQNHILEIDGKNFETIGKGIYFLLSPKESVVYNILHDILKSIIEYSILKEEYINI